jgi:hypothetical protein
MTRKCESKASSVDVGAFSEQRQYNCPRCGRACVCVRLNLFPADKPVFMTLHWECEACTATKGGERNGN